MPYQPNQRRKKNVVFRTVPVNCPRCGVRLLDEVPPVVTEVRQLHLALDAPEDSWRPDYNIKCPKCGAYIAFRKSIAKP